MDCKLPGSSVHGIFQARMLEWVAISFSRGSSWSRDQTQVSCIVGTCFTIWVRREAWTLIEMESIYIYIYIYICMYVYMCVHVCIYAYTHMYTCNTAMLFYMTANQQSTKDSLAKLLLFWIIYLFFAAWGLSLAVVGGYLISVASLVLEHEL